MWNKLAANRAAESTVQSIRLSDLVYVTQGKAGLVVVGFEVVAEASPGNMLIESKLYSFKSMRHVSVYLSICVCMCLSVDIFKLALHYSCGCLLGQLT